MKKTILTKVVPLSIAAVSTLGFATGAQAMSFKVSGHVDRALTWASNGKNSAVGQVDNNGSDSRFRFTGSQVMNNGMKVGFLYEMGIKKNSSSSWDIGSGTSNSNNAFNLRSAEAYLEGNFGKVSFGRGNSAAAYTETIDLSGTSWLGGGVWYELYSGGITYVDGNGNSIATISQTQSPFQFIGSRTNRVRYDTPSMGGLVFSGSYSEGNAYTVAARYKATLMNGVKLAAGFGWGDSENSGNVRDPGTWALIGSDSRHQTYGGSASILLPNGLNMTISGTRDKTLATGHTEHNLFGQVGYIVGKNHFAINYGQTKDRPVNGVKGSQIGVAYVYDWTHSVQLFASFHNYSLTLPDSVKAANEFGSPKDINQLYIGTRIKFL